MAKVYLEKHAKLDKAQLQNADATRTELSPEPGSAAQTSASPPPTLLPTR
jgi:hypothetical protein